MEIITEKKIYKEYYSELTRHPDEKGFKQILNNYFNPDRYLGFYFPEHNEFIPLVEKNGVVYFFGGNFYNEKNLIPSSCVNSIICYLVENKFTFRLLSILEDYFPFIDNRFKTFDVPYSQNWYISDVRDFDIKKQQANLEKNNKKRSARIRRSIKKRHGYYLEEIQPCNTSRIHKIINQVSTSFNMRNKVYDWKEKENLLFKILNFFALKQLSFFVMHHHCRQDVGWFCVVKNNKYHQNILFNIINKNYENDVIILFLKMIEVLKDNQCENFDFMRGDFGYKGLCGCEYKPLFALTNDSSWTPQYNKDLKKEEIINLIGRDFGCFSHL